LFYSFDHGGGTEAQPGITGEEVLNGWKVDIRDDELAPALKKVKGKYNSYVFAQCFGGGMLDDLMLLPGNAFGCSATNHYEYSYGDDFASAFVDALLTGRRNTTSLFQYAWQNDASAVQTSYPANGGTYIYGKEHPWWTGASFSMFLPPASGASNSAQAAVGKPMSLPPANGPSNRAQAAPGPDQPQVGNLLRRNGQALLPLGLLELQLLGAGTVNQNLPNSVQASKAIGPSAAGDRHGKSEPAERCSGQQGLGGNDYPAKCSPTNSSSRDPMGYLDRELAKEGAIDALFAQDAEFLAGMASLPN
jgi:hypothetical protein